MPRFKPVHLPNSSPVTIIRFMKKALPLGLLLCFVFSLFSTTSTFANDGSNRPAANHRPYEPTTVAPSTGQTQGFWGSLWGDILGFFGHHDHHAAPSGPGAGVGLGSGSNAPGAGGSAPSAPSGAGAGGAGSPSVPVNGGLVLLLAAGLSFGIIQASKYKTAPQH